jgi:hypothetical protein
MTPAPDTLAAIERVREALHFCADVHGDRTAQAVDATRDLDTLAAALARVERLEEALREIAEDRKGRFDGPLAMRDRARAALAPEAGSSG